MSLTPARGQYADARVFIVDDNAANVALLVAVLDRAGYRKLFTEMDPRQVLPRLPVVDPDLIILDLHMPHLDGFAVLEQIRGFTSAEALPVLVLTADTTPAASERALSSGAQDFVTKPFSNGEVLVRVQNLLRARFLYTALRSSILHEREAVVRARWLTSAFDSEQQTSERLRFLDGLKDTLLQTVSHDLRNPIWAVQLMTDILAADADGTQPLSTEARSAVIEKVARNARQMARLLADILDSDPMRTIDEHRNLCDVGEIVSRVMATVDLGRDHPLEIDIAPGSVAVDPVHLERIVENLLNNARQHVAAGVPIWVRATRRHDGMILSVEDAGTGVPAELTATIFEPFRRGRTSSVEGLGLGLSLVSRFAQLHGGRAWIETREGGGASFRVFLPSEQTSRSQQAAPVDLADSRPA